MSRSLDAATTAAVALDVTRPFYLVYLGFDSPIRYSTTATISWNSQTWTAAGMTIRHGDNPVVSIYNEGTTLGQLVLTEGTAGRTIQIYQAYYYGSPITTEAIEIFNGTMSDANIGEFVEIRCKRTEQKRTPRHFVVPPTFNHVPPSGTRIETAAGIFILEGE